VNQLPQQKSALPEGVILDERPPFVPRLVMTPHHQSVTKQVMHQWRNREHFKDLRKFGIRPLDRLLFYGPPGNGKTLTCYWLAKELDVPIYRVICNQLVSSYVGATTKAIADAAEFLNSQTKPCICLWDEVESIFIDRSRTNSSAGREISAALTVFMQALDRWRAPTLIAMATNLPEKLDAALLSRVEMKVEFVGPTLEQAKLMLEYWSELLCNHGSAEWGLGLLEQIETALPQSFRELQQTIAWCARDWVARRCS